MVTRMRIALSPVALAFALATPSIAQTELPTLGPTNLDDWLEAIEPDELELSFQQVGWRNRLGPAIAEARELGRPILLWTMNGHPLGCT